MTNISITLTDKAIATLPLSTGKPYFVRDNELTGFGLFVGKRAKTFYAEGAYWENNKCQFRTSKKIGVADQMTSREARAKAKEIIGNIAKGVRPGETTKRTGDRTTLRQAWARYKEKHLIRKGRRPTTIAGYEDHMTRLLGDWLDKACLLRKEDVEIPSDLFGVIYTDMDSNGAWKTALIGEMKAANVAFDANKLWS